MAVDVVEIDVVSDVMCPWCYIGKRRLEKALKLIPQDIEVKITWRPFQLDARIEPTGRDRKTYLEQKFGSEEGIAQVYDPIAKSGKEEGLEFNLEGIQVSPNTFDCHRLLHWADIEGVQNELAELLFKAYFIDAKDLTKNETLVALAVEAGMDGEVTKRLLESDADKEEVQSEIDKYRQMGVQSVPTMLIGKKYAVMGARDDKTIAEVIEGVHQERLAERAEASVH